MADQHNAQGKFSTRPQVVKHGQYGPPNSDLLRGGKQSGMRDTRQLQQTPGAMPVASNTRTKTDK